MNKEVVKKRNKLLKDLEKIFELALIAKDYKAAIQAKQIIGKINGLLDKDLKKQPISLTELTHEDIDTLLLEAEQIQENNIQKGSNDGNII